MAEPIIIAILLLVFGAQIAIFSVLGRAIHKNTVGRNALFDIANSDKQPVQWLINRAKTALKEIDS